VALTQSGQTAFRPRSVIIEKLTPEKVNEALALYQGIFGVREHTTSQEIMHRLSNKHGIFYVAIDTETGEIIGIKFGYVEGNTCIGRGIAVLPQYRRQGIGTQLLRRFEIEMQFRSDISKYVFGSASNEGVPFHLASGYLPKVLIQFEDSRLREWLDLAGFIITQEGYNQEYKVYQIYLELEQPQQNLAYLRTLQDTFPETDVQFVFSKRVKSDEPIRMES
jgi:GNAT superfamily N-acetyltransferase